MFFKLCTRNLYHTRNKMTSDRVVAKETNLVSSLSLSKTRSPSPGNCNHLIFLSRRFHRPIYFQFEFISNSDPVWNLSDQLQSQARTNIDMSKWCQHIHWDPIVLALWRRARADWNWPFFAGKISKADWSVNIPLHLLSELQTPSNGLPHKPNIPIFKPLKWHRRSCLEQTWWLPYFLNSHH